MGKSYWMLVLSPENFDVTRRLGFKFQGIRAHHPRKVQRVGPDDRILYYLSHRRCFAATATVTSPYLEDRNSAWHQEGSTQWTHKVGIQPDQVLAPEDYMDAGDIAPRLDYVRRWIPEQWYMAFQGDLHLLPKKDFQLVEEEMRKLLRQRTKRASQSEDSRTPEPMASRSP